MKVNNAASGVREAVFPSPSTFTLPSACNSSLDCYLGKTGGLPPARRIGNDRSKPVAGKVEVEVALECLADLLHIFSMTRLIRPTSKPHLVMTDSLINTRSETRYILSSTRRSRVPSSQGILNT